MQRAFALLLLHNLEAQFWKIKIDQQILSATKINWRMRKVHFIDQTLL